MPLSSTPTISMSDLRVNPGTIMDRVFYRKETFLIEKAGKARAVLIPLAEYEQMQKRKREARERFWQMTLQLRKAFAGVDPDELAREIDKAIKEVRAEKRAA